MIGQNWIHAPSENSRRRGEEELCGIRGENFQQACGPTISSDQSRPLLAPGGNVRWKGERTVPATGEEKKTLISQVEGEKGKKGRIVGHPHRGTGRLRG